MKHALRIVWCAVSLENDCPRVGSGGGLNADVKLEFVRHEADLLMGRVADGA